MHASELTEDTLIIFAAKHYYNPLGVDADEFKEDLKRFKYVKRLVNRYLEGGELPLRLILNHLIVIFNVFGVEGGLAILNLRMESRHMPVLKPFLIFLGMIKYNDKRYIGTSQDWLVVEELRRI
jgi:hypothetical protein